MRKRLFVNMEMYHWDRWKSSVCLILQYALPRKGGIMTFVPFTA